MMVPLHDPRREVAGEESEVRRAVLAVLGRGRFVMGEEHDAFERALADYCGVRHAVGVANGTDALEIVLRAVGVARGDEVVTAANAGGYATAACVAIGAVPVFADVSADTLTIEPRAVAAALSERTRAVVVTHLYGILADVSGVGAVLDSERVAIIEDCAQAHGARRDGRRAGAFGRAGAFSFYPTKNLGALGDAGAIVTDDPWVAEQARRLRQYGWEDKYRSVIPFGRNSRLDEIQAAVLRAKLPDLDRRNERRRAIVERYRRTTEGALDFVGRTGDDFVAHLCVVRHPRRDDLRRALEARGVATAIHYPTADHRQPSLADVPWRATSLDVTERSVGEILTVPCFPEMTGDEVDAVATALRDGI